MTKRWPSTACLFGIGSVALVGVTACSERDLGRTQRASHAASDEQLVGDRERVERRAPDRIGNDFACAVISKRTAVRPRRLLVYVTSSEAADRARRFVGELKSASRIAVRTTSPQFRRRTMVEIRNSIEKSLPPDGTGAGIGLESPIDRRGARGYESTFSRKAKPVPTWSDGQRTPSGDSDVIASSCPDIRAQTSGFSLGSQREGGLGRAVASDPADSPRFAGGLTS